MYLRRSVTLNYLARAASVPAAEASRAVAPPGRNLSQRHRFALALGTRLLAVLITGAFTLLGVAPVATAAAPLGGAGGGAYVDLSGSPGVPAIDSQTGTIYVPVQCPKSYCPTSAAGRVVEIVSAARCNTTDHSGCRVLATAPAEQPLAAAVDEVTDTVYLANAGGTVTVLDGSTCNATVTSGCSKDLSTIKVGGFLVDDVIDPLTNTLYLASPNRGVLMVDLAHCNSEVTSGCGEGALVVKDAGGPASLDVDIATDTVYAANDGVGNNGGNGNTVSVVDGATCNAADQAGCGQRPKTVTVGSGANWDVVDQASGTVYVANFNDNTVSVLDGARCNATVSSGCAATPPAVPTGENPADVVVDPKLHTLFTLNQSDDTLSELSTSACAGPAAAAGSKAMPSANATPDGPAGYNGEPNTVLLTPQNNTAYIVNVGAGAVMSVVSMARCNALDTSGCRVEQASTPNAEYWETLDPSTGTLYASNANDPVIDVINASACDLRHLAACTPVARITVKDPADAMEAIDNSTHTLYASDPTNGTVSVIDTATCNAGVTSGCKKPYSVITIGPSAGSPVVDSGTATLYVPYGKLLNKVAVVDIATCNAEEPSGCSLRRGTVGEGTHELAIDYATGTL
jgi:DNA-binding beta-propeller fold protein YncE